MAQERGGGLAVALLRLLADGGIRSAAELARRLDVSEALVTALAGELTRQGYLEALGMGCAAGCRGCAQAVACADDKRGAQGVRLLALTEQGRRAAGLSAV